jgi:hypothetical protein
MISKAYEPFLRVFPSGETNWTGASVARIAADRAAGFGFQPDTLKINRRSGFFAEVDIESHQA